MSVVFCLPHPVALSVFIICRGVGTRILWMCVLIVRFGPRYDPEPLNALPWVVQCCLF